MTKTKTNHKVNHNDGKDSMLCDACGGSGTVIQRWSSEDGIGMSDFRACKKCYGMGHVYEELDFGEQVRFQIVAIAPDIFSRFILSAHWGGVFYTFEAYRAGKNGDGYCLKNPKGGPDPFLPELDKAMDVAAKIVMGKLRFSESVADGMRMGMSGALHAGLKTGEQRW